jgi:hypothetical protein
MSDPIPRRFHESQWTCLEVLGWIIDRDPELFGRLECLSDVDRALLRDRVRFPPLNEAPAQSLMYALREGQVKALSDGIALPPDSWSGRKIDDAILFNREGVLKVWPLLEWLPLPNAAATIIRHRDNIKIPEAQAALIDACADGILRARTPNFEIPAHWWLKGRIDGYSLHSLTIDEDRPKEYRTGEAHELEDVEINADDLRRWLGQDNGSPLASVEAVVARQKQCSNSELEEFIEAYLKSAKQPTQDAFVKAADKANLRIKRESLRAIYTDACRKRGIVKRLGRPKNLPK